MTVKDWDVYARLYTKHPETGNDIPAHDDSCSVSALHPGTAAEKAWIVISREVKSRNIKLPKIHRVVFSVTRKEATRA